MQVLLGGGQEASQVTTTAARVGKFEVRVYHKVLEEEIGRVKGHFGPINSVTFSPDGKGYVKKSLFFCVVCLLMFFAFVLFCSFASGGEDGYVRLHHFDPDYFSFEVEY